MRLFVAIPLAEPARSEVVRVLSELRAAEWPVRWVSDALIHVTLKFFGETPDERLDVVAEALRHACAGTQPMLLRLSQLGAFPTEERPRILWAGLESHRALAGLRDRIESACDAIGFAPEGTPFQPHVTLGRMREGQRLPAGALAARKGTLARETFIAGEVILYESIQTAGGPRYVSRSTIALGE